MDPTRAWTPGRKHAAGASMLQADGVGRRMWHTARNLWDQSGIPCRGSQVVLRTVCSQLYAHNCMLTTVCSQLYGVPQNCMVKLYVCRSYVKLYALIVINYLRKRLASNSLIKLSVKLK